MQCMSCTGEVVLRDERYVCMYCQVSFPEELVVPKKRPIITHFET